MSICRDKTLKCPDCGILIKAVIWDSINVQLNPEAREALLKGDLHQVTCPQCKAVRRVDKVLLYHDMENQFMVWYYPFDTLDDPGFFNSFSNDGRLDMRGDFGNIKVSDYLRNVHYVFSMGELVRYILFREKLAAAKEIVIQGEYAE